MLNTYKTRNTITELKHFIYNIKVLLENISTNTAHDLVKYEI